MHHDLEEKTPLPDISFNPKSDEQTGKEFIQTVCHYQKTLDQLKTVPEIDKYQREWKPAVMGWFKILCCCCPPFQKKYDDWGAKHQMAAISCSNPLALPIDRKYNFKSLERLYKEKLIGTNAQVLLNKSTTREDIVNVVCLIYKDYIPLCYNGNDGISWKNDEEDRQLIENSISSMSMRG